MAALHHPFFAQWSELMNGRFRHPNRYRIIRVITDQCERWKMILFDRLHLIPYITLYVDLWTSGFGLLL